MGRRVIEGTELCMNVESCFPLDLKDFKVGFLWDPTNSI